jgi:hypothetical protein
MSELTDRQLQVLRWFNENPSTCSRWLVNGRDPRASEGPDKWSHMEVSGANGSIVIRTEDWQATKPYRSVCPSHDKMWGINEKARAVLSSEGQQT